MRPAGSLHWLLYSDKNTSGVGAHGRGRERGQDAVGKGAQGGLLGAGLAKTMRPSEEAELRAAS